MKRVEVKVFNEQGIHARPSTKICNIPTKFTGNVHFKFQDVLYDAKNIMAIMLIGLEKGNIFEIIADGENENDEIKILNDLKNLIEIEQFK